MAGYSRPTTDSNGLVLCEPYKEERDRCRCTMCTAHAAQCEFHIVKWIFLKRKKLISLLTLKQIAGNSQNYNQNENGDYEQSPDHWKMSKRMDKNGKLERVGRSLWKVRKERREEFRKESNHAGNLLDRHVLANTPQIGLIKVVG